MTTHVPAGNIAGMVFALAVAWGMPAALFFLLYKKKNAKVLPFFLGCGSFFLFAMVLEQLLHMLVLLKLGSVSEMLKANLWLYALYGGLAAGLFEETGRFLAMKYFMKTSSGREDALMYGAGHGGMEAVLVLGIPSINNLVSAVLLNSGKFLSSLADDSNAQQVLERLSPLWTLPAWQFFLGGVERILAICLHVALSLLVYRAVKEKRRWYLYPCAILLHAALNMVVVLIANHGSLVLAELATLAGTVAVGALAWRYV